jgi:hypothetical protein
MDLKILKTMRMKLDRMRISKEVNRLPLILIEWDRIKMMKKNRMIVILRLLGVI